MNETTFDAALPPKKNKGWGDRLFFGIVGPNEQDALRPYAPYYPSFNLFPAKPLPPFWSIALASALLGALIVGTGAFLLNSLTGDNENRKEELQREIAFQKSMATLVAKAESQKSEANAQLALFRKVDERLFRWSQALDIFRCLTPADTRLTSLKGNSEGQILVNGEATDLTGIGYLMLNLRGSGLFYKPKLFTSELSEAKGQKLFHFTLSSELMNPASISAPVASP